MSCTYIPFSNGNVLEDDGSLGGSLEVLVIRDFSKGSLIVKVFSCSSLVKERLSL
jgi:hypothetical protein